MSLRGCLSLPEGDMLSGLIFVGFKFMYLNYNRILTEIYIAEESILEGMKEGEF